MIFLRINCPNVIGLVWRRRQCQTASGATAARPHGVLIVAAPPRHSTPPSTALIEGKGVNRFQARSVALLVYKCVSMEQHLVPSSAGGLRGSTSSTLRLITVHGCQLSATEPFPSLQLAFGTVCHSMSRLHYHCPPQSLEDITWDAATLDCSHHDCTVVPENLRICTLFVCATCLLTSYQT